MLFSYSHKAMDTAFNVMIRAAKNDENIAAAAASAAFAKIDELEGLLSKFHDSSDVAVISALRPGDTAVVAPETMEILSISAKVAAATQGAFDPSLGNGFGRLTLDPEHLLVAVSFPAGSAILPLCLDFGGIGKGYALDECRKILSGPQFALTDYLLDAGTSTIWAQGDSWPLGVGGQWKKRTRKPNTLNLSGCALSGSGKELKGEHIVDPRKGTPAGQWEQTWAKASSGAVADALSTAALSMTRKEIKSACDSLEAGVMVAIRQKEWIDRFRDPLLEFGDFF